MVFFAGSSVTGDSFLESYLGRVQAGGGGQAAGPTPADDEEVNRYDVYRNQWTLPHIPEPLSPLRPPAASQSNHPFLNQPFVNQGSGRHPSSKHPFLGQSFVNQKGIKEPVTTQPDTREAERKRLVELAIKAGLIGDNYLPSELDAIWQQAVDEAEASGRMGDNTTPWDILEHWSTMPITARRYAQPGASAPELEDLEPGAGDPAPQERRITNRHTQTSLTDEDTARAVITRGLRDYLGRKPTDAEIRKFHERLNKAEKANPTITDTEQVISPTGESTVTESVTEGGAPSPTAFADNFAEDNFEDEAFAYLMGSQGADIMRALVGSIA